MTEQEFEELFARPGNFLRRDVAILKAFNAFKEAVKNGASEHGAFKQQLLCFAYNWPDPHVGDK